MVSSTDDDEWVEPTPPWELKIPVALLIFGLLILLIHGLVSAGISGGAGVLINIGLLLVVYLPLTIIAMFIAAPILDLSFGELRPAILKIAGLYIFTAAVQDVGGAMGHPILGGIIALGLSLFLYSKAFSFTAMETIEAVIVVAVVRGLISWAIGSWFSR
jgi:hypothetical protein